MPLDDPHFVKEIRLLRERVPSFDPYRFNLPAVRSLEALPLHPKATFLVDENGSGKSTLCDRAIRYHSPLSKRATKERKLEVKT